MSFPVMNAPDKAKQVGGATSSCDLSGRRNCKNKWIIQNGLALIAKITQNYRIVWGKLHRITEWRGFSSENYNYRMAWF